MAPTSPWDPDTLMRRIHAVDASHADLTRRSNAVRKRLAACGKLSRQTTAELGGRSRRGTLRAIAHILPRSLRWSLWWRRMVGGSPRK